MIGLKAIAVVAALGIAASVASGFVAYRKGYTNGSNAVEMKYHKAAQIIQGKIDNAKVPKSEEELLDDLRNRRF